MIHNGRISELHKWHGLWDLVRSPSPSRRKYRDPPDERPIYISSCRTLIGLLDRYRLIDPYAARRWIKHGFNPNRARLFQACRREDPEASYQWICHLLPPESEQEAQIVIGEILRYRQNDLQTTIDVVYEVCPYTFSSS